MLSKLEDSRESIFKNNKFGYLAYAVNSENADKLWTISEDFLKDF